MTISSGNERLRQTRDLLAGLIADYDSLITEVRVIRTTSFQQNGSTMDPEYIRRFVEQRAVLAAAASMIKDMTIEWRQDSTDGHAAASNGRLKSP